MRLNERWIWSAKTNLKIGQSYLYIFAFYMLFFITAFSFGATVDSSLAYKAIAIVSIAMLVFLIVSQLRSGLALDSYWVARHPRGSWQFLAMIALSLSITLLLIGIVISGWNSVPS